MKNTIQYPDYDRCILSVSASLLSKFGLKSNYPTLKELDKYLEKNYKNIIFLIIDCLGSEILEKDLNEYSILKKHIRTNITTVFPSTTVAATTAFHSGISTLENGWIGWMPYFREYNDIIEIFTSKQFYTGKKLDIPDIGKNILQYETIYSKIIKKNSDVIYHKIFPSFVPNGAKTIEELCNNIYKACINENKCNLISAYWNEPDHTIHRTGVTSKETKQVLENIDGNIKQLIDKLDDSLIIISADHGAIDVEEIYINEYKELVNCLKMPPSIETRFVTFFVKENMKEIFKENFENIFNKDFLLFTKEEFSKSNLLGRGKKHYKIDEYLGDFMAISISNKAIRYTIDGNKFKKLIADHAGMTKEEMEVPVIIIEKE